MEYSNDTPESLYYVPFTDWILVLVPVRRKGVYNRRKRWKKREVKGIIDIFHPFFSYEKKKYKDVPTKFITRKSTYCQCSKLSNQIIIVTSELLLFHA